MSQNCSSLNNLHKVKSSNLRLEASSDKSAYFQILDHVLPA